MLGAVSLDTAVNVYFKPEVLERDIGTLREAGYRCSASLRTTERTGLLSMTV